MSTRPVPRPLISGETKKRDNLDVRVCQELKIEIHRQLLNRVDVEKVATQRDEHTVQQVYSAIQQLVSNLKVPLPPGAAELSGPEKERLSQELLD
jgi:hypothetical protein